MPTPELAVSVETIREAAKRAAEAEGVRKTARDTGLSVTGFRAFLAGSEPYESTRRKLTGWYVRRVASGAVGPTGAVADAALSLLVEHLPAEERERAVREIRAAVERRTKSAMLPLPDWVEEMGP